MHAVESGLREPQYDNVPPTDCTHALAQLTRYQEQPQLLDSCLEGIVQPLSFLLRAHAVDFESTASVSSTINVCRLLQVLVLVRGYKTIVKFFPHDAADLERVLQVRSKGT